MNLEATEAIDWENSYNAALGGPKFNQKNMRIKGA